jgi:sec-independent protein translocase protein TatB
MFDIGAMELFVVAILALVVVGPKELPKLLRTIGGYVRQARGMANEFRRGIENLAEEVEAEVGKIDPFKDLREEEGLTKGMTPEEITEKIMGNRESEIADAKQKTETEKKASSDDDKEVR